MAQQRAQRTDRQPIERNLAMELVRVTEAASLSAVRYMGTGDKELVDQAAVDAMRHTLQGVSMDGVVVIGEGEKDEAPMLYNGEHIGNGSDPKVDIAVDPIDGTTLLSKGLPGAIAVIAMSARDSMHVAKEVFYMDKIAVGPAARGVVDIDAPVAENLKKIAKALGKAVSEVTVVMLDRPRHANLLKDIRAAGARVKMISDGDVAAGIQAALARQWRRRAAGYRRHAGGRDHGGGTPLHGRRDPLQAVAARRRRAQKVPRRRGRPYACL